MSVENVGKEEKVQSHANDCGTPEMMLKAAIWSQLGNIEGVLRTVVHDGEIQLTVRNNQVELAVKKAAPDMKFQGRLITIKVLDE